MPRRSRVATHRRGVQRYFAAVYDALGVNPDRRGHRRQEPLQPHARRTSPRSSRQKGLARISEGALCAFPPDSPGAKTNRCPSSCASKTAATATPRPTSPPSATAPEPRRATHHLRRRRAPEPTPRHGLQVRRACRLARAARPCRTRGLRFGARAGQEDVQDPKRRDGAAHRSAQRSQGPGARHRTEKNPTLDEATRVAVAPAVGVGAVKYADLSSDRIKDYVFDWSRMLAFEATPRPTCSTPTPASGRSSPGGR